MESHPSHRIHANRFEAGAAWTKQTNDGREYLSLKLDDPTFTAPIFANLFEDKDGKGHSLVWSRLTRCQGGVSTPYYALPGWFGRSHPREAEERGCANGEGADNKNWSEEKHHGGLGMQVIAFVPSTTTALPYSIRSSPGLESSSSTEEVLYLLIEFGEPGEARRAAVVSAWRTTADPRRGSAAIFSPGSAS